VKYPFNATRGQFTTAKTSGCANVSSNISRAEKAAFGIAGILGSQFETC